MKGQGVENREQEAVSNMKPGCIRCLCVHMDVGVGRAGEEGERGDGGDKGEGGRQTEGSQEGERDPVPMLFLQTNPSTYLSIESRAHYITPRAPPVRHDKLASLKSDAKSGP